MAAAKEKSDDAGDNGAQDKAQDGIGKADTGFRDCGKGDQRHISRSKAAPENGQVVDKTLRKGVVLLKGCTLQRPAVLAEPNGSDKVVITLGFDEVSKVHPVGFRAQTA